MSNRRVPILYLRIALGVAFLSAVIGRLHAWPVSFEHFLVYTARVNSFLPAATIPFLAWIATLAETVLGILLIAGLWPRPVALAASLLLALFGTAMAISFGIKEPLDYSVFSASAGALLLAFQPMARREG
jgi:putative oxidoreductase